ncbi:MAG: clostripain-related cysteine peptidase [Rikenellaceae bacterium]
MKKIIIILITSISLLACKKTEETKFDDSLPVDAFLMYCASYNNLNSDLSQNINDLLENYTFYGNKRIYIFFSDSNYYSYLYRVNTKGEKELIKEYGYGLNAATIETLEEVMSDVASQSDVIELTDILLSSHGMSWLPNGQNPKELSTEASWSGSYLNYISSYSFGYDKSDTSEGIEIDEMAELFENYNLQTIIFDACFMGSIETYYELRNSADYILASPCEILSAGMNYSDMSKYLTKESSLDNLSKIAYATYDLYNTSYTGTNQTSALSIVDCAKLESFGNYVKNIMDKYSAYSSSAIPDIRYDSYSTKYAHDLKLYLENLIELGGGTEYDELQTYWYDTFPYYYKTEYLFDYMPTVGSGGVAAYIYRSTVLTSINSFYLSLDWGELIM